MRHLAYPVGKQRAQKRVIAVPELRPGKHIARLAVAERKRIQPVYGQYSHIGRGGHAFRERLERRAVRYVPLRQHRACLHLSVRFGLQPPLFNELGKTEPAEQAVQLRLIVMVPDGLRRRKRDRRVGADGSQLERQFGAFTSLSEFFAHALFHIERVQFPVNGLDRSEPCNEILCRLLSDTRHTGDIVRTVAHESFQIDHADGIKAVLRAEHLGRVFHRLRLSHAGLNVADVGRVRNELEAVLIARDDDALPPGALAALADRAEQIVRLIPLQLQTAHAHGVKRLLQQRHLHGQLLRHRLALRLVAVVLFVAERRRAQIERDAQRLRHLQLQHALQDGQKAVHTVGGRAVRRVEHPHAVKRAVDDAVAVKDHQFHSGSSLLGGN